MRAAIIALALSTASAFVAAPPAPRAVASPTALSAYVPSGMSKEAYAKLKKQEADDKKKKNFGAGGARGFQSRSMASFIVAKEKGEAQHLFPVDPEKVRRGEIALKDVPYMQRGGSWDNSDITNKFSFFGIGKKKGWETTGFGGMKAYNDGKAQKFKANKFDVKYNNAKPNVGIFGDAGAVDWTGRGARSGGGKEAGSDGVAGRARKNGISADQQMWRDSGALGKKEIERLQKRGSQANINAPEKKFFGLF